MGSRIGVNPKPLSYLISKEGGSTQRGRAGKRPANLFDTARGQGKQRQKMPSQTNFVVNKQKGDKRTIEND